MTNTDRVKAMYAAFERGDVGAIMDSVADDVQWDFEAPSVVPYSGLRRGKAEVMGFFAGIGSSEEAQKAIQALNGTDLDGRSLTVNEARPQEKRSGFGGDRGGERRGGGGGRNRW